jgi:hypothetical protein
MRPASIEKLPEIKPASQRGGSRLGSGRKPKALRFAKQVALAEQKIVAAVPELLDLLLSAARGGDTSAAKYLVDRVLGRVQTQAKPLAEDFSLPSTHPAAGEIAAMRRRREIGKAMARPANTRDEIWAAEHSVTEAETTADFPGSTEEFARAKVAFPDSAACADDVERRSANG